MIYAEAACLAGILVFGAVSTYTDFRKGIISNKLILAGIAYGVLCHIALLLSNESSYYPYWLLYMLIADLFAFGMFWGKLWAAGDAKLFMMLFFLTPPRLFDAGQLSNSVAPYIFIFIPALAWMLIDSMIRAIRKEPRKRQPLDTKKWLVGCLKIIMEASFFHSLMRLLVPSFVAENAFFVSTLIMVYAYMCGNLKIMKRCDVVALHAVGTFCICLLKGWTAQIPDLICYLVLVAVMIVQRVGGMYNYQLIPAAKAVKGMIPAAETVILFQTSRVQNLPSDLSEQLTARMTEEQANAIRRWEKSARGKAEIWIVRKTPFAIMIVTGFTVWMIIKLVG